MAQSVGQERRLAFPRDITKVCGAFVPGRHYGDADPESIVFLRLVLDWSSGVFPAAETANVRDVLIAHIFQGFSG